MDAAQRSQLFERVDRHTQLPMMVLAIGSVPVLLGPLALTLPVEVENTFEQLDLYIWAAFAAELALKTYLAPSRLSYLRTNWIDVVLVALPFLRPFRLVRFLRVAVFAARVGVGLRRLLLGHGLAYSLLTGLGIVLVSAFAMSVVERGAENATITGFPDALWWAATTVTTVGYGDKFPVTLEGRAIAVLLMVAGITMFGVLTASLAAFFLESGRGDDAMADVIARLERIEQKLKEPDAS